MDELMKYIVESRAHGFSDEQINEELVKNGWEEAIVINAIKQMRMPIPPSFNPQSNFQTSENNDSNSIEDSEYIPGVMVLLKEAIQKTRSRVKTYLAVMLYGGGIITLCVILFVVLGIPTKLFFNGSNSLFVWLLILIVPIYIYLTIWTSSALLLVFSTEMTFKQIWNELTFKQLLKIAWTNLVATCVMLGSAVLLFIPLAWLFVVFMFYQYTAVVTRVSGLKTLYLTDAYLEKRKLAVLWKAYAGPLLMGIIVAVLAIVWEFLKKSPWALVLLLIFVVLNLSMGLIWGNYMGILYRYISNRKVDLDNIKKSKLIIVSLFLSVLGIPILFLLPLLMINPKVQLEKAHGTANQMENNQELNLGGLGGLDPSAMRIKAQDAGRSAQIRLIASGLESYRKNYPKEYSELNIGTEPRGIGTKPGLVDLTILEKMAEIKELKYDPIGGSKEDTKYLVKVNSNDEIVVMAESHYYDGTMIMSNQEFNFKKESTNIRRDPLPTPTVKKDLKY